jgi:tight adherence protein C
VLFASDLIDFEQVLPFALFLTFAALAWWALEYLAASKPRALERLDELRNPKGRKRFEEQPITKSDAMIKVLEKASPLGKSLEPKSEAELGKLRARLTQAGFRSEAAGGIFLGLKFLGLMVGLLLGGTVILPVLGIEQSSLVAVVALGGVLFYLPDVVVGLMGHSRRQQIFLGLPDALDLMVVCVEAGLALDQAMRRVADEMKRSSRVLSEEFAVSNFQLQMGRPKAQVLHELGARTGVQDLRTLAGVIVQADRFGSSIAGALRVQSDSMRTRRRQLAEEKAAKTAVKLIFPLVLFIFPGIFVVLVGPAAITMMRQMFPMMGG